MFTTRPEIVGTFGVAASTHWIASQVAMGALERGGNAFDAAVTAAFVLHVVEPHLNGPGGECAILYWNESHRHARYVDGQGWAPAAATPSEFRRRGLELVPGIGLLPAAVPGAVPAWLTLLAQQGTFTLVQALSPAIGYASKGFPVALRLAEGLMAVRELFLAHWHSSAATWLVDAKVPRPGSLHRLPQLADTYRRLIVEAEQRGISRVGAIEAAIDIWQRGFVAREIDRFSRISAVRDSSGEAHIGLLRFDDMAEWRVATDAPAQTDFDRYTILKGGFGSQGPTMLQQFALLRHAGLGRFDSESSAFIHHVAEAAKLSFADRLAWYGRAPGADELAQAALLSDGYAAQRWASLNLAGAASELTAGSPLGRAPILPDLSAAERTARNADMRFGVGEPTFAKLSPTSQWVDREIFVGDTCHIDVIDREGNMVSATPSGGWMSSSPTILELGFALGTRLQSTWLDEGLPNTLTPRIAPMHTLSPSLALRDGEPYLAFGTPGGDQQDQWATTFFLHHALHGLNLQQAIDCPAWHVTHYPSSFWPRLQRLNKLTVESRFGDDVIGQLQSLGHNVEIGEPWSEGRLTACSRKRDRRGRLVLRAGANPRGMQGYAVGRYSAVRNIGDRRRAEE